MFLKGILLLFLIPRLMPLLTDWPLMFYALFLYFYTFGILPLLDFTALYDSMPMFCSVFDLLVSFFELPNRDVQSQDIRMLNK